MAMDRIPGYWETVYSNVKAAYDNGLFTEKQWELYNNLYENREIETGRQYELPELHDELMENLTIDLKQLYKQQKVDLILMK